jgi:hypothetical protein
MLLMVSARQVWPNFNPRRKQESSQHDGINENSWYSFASIAFD